MGRWFESSRAHRIPHLQPGTCSGITGGVLYSVQDFASRLRRREDGSGSNPAALIIFQSPQENTIASPVSPELSPQAPEFTAPDKSAVEVTGLCCRFAVAAMHLLKRLDD